MTRIKGDIRKVVTYFNKTKVYNQGYLKFNIINKKIKYCLGNNLSTYKSRKVFTELRKINEPFRGITITFD